MKTVWFLTLFAAILVALGYNTGAAWHQEAGLDSTNADSAQVRVIKPVELPLDQMARYDDFDFFPEISIVEDTAYYIYNRTLRKLHLPTGKSTIDSAMTDYLVYSLTAAKLQNLKYINGSFYHSNGRLIYKVNRDGTIAQCFGATGHVHEFTS